MSEGFSIPAELLKADPVLPLPTREQVWVAAKSNKLPELEQALRNRAEAIALRSSDPLRYGYEPPTFKQARDLVAEFDELLLQGGNREGKTNFAAKFCVETLVSEPGAIVAFFHSSETSSRNQQQPVVFSFLPPEWRAIAQKATRAANKKADTYLSYSKGTGFTGNQFILPNGSMGLFFNYKQDVGVMEGYAFRLVWFDELVPPAFLEALAFRLDPSVRLVVLTTFTPVRGYTQVVANYIAGGRVVKTLPAGLLAADKVHVPGCPPGHMPYVMQGRRPKSAVLFFHNGSNPFGAAKKVREKLVGATAQTIMIRAYGWASKQIAGVFAKFTPEAHVVKRARWAELAKGAGTRYCVTDPRPGANWFIKWYFVTPEGATIVYREWPDKARFGEWALPPTDGTDGRLGRTWRTGPAMYDGAGRGIIAYKELILKAEGWRWDEEKGAWDDTGAEKIERRLIDPRMGGAEIPSVEEGTSLIAMMDEEQRNGRGQVVGPSMMWEPAPGGDVGAGVEMIANKMDYDEGRAVDALNAPAWFVVEDCEQSILAYQEYTNAGGEKDALKDILDCDRYFVTDDCDYVAPNAMRMRSGGYY